jgi:hypothetical protein
MVSRVKAREETGEVKLNLDLEADWSSGSTVYVEYHPDSILYWLVPTFS